MQPDKTIADLCRIIEILETLQFELAEPHLIQIDNDILLRLKRDPISLAQDGIQFPEKYLAQRDELLKIIEGLDSRDVDYPTEPDWRILAEKILGKNSSKVKSSRGGVSITRHEGAAEKINALLKSVVLFLSQCAGISESDKQKMSLREIYATIQGVRDMEIWKASLYAEEPKGELECK